MACPLLEVFKRLRMYNISLPPSLGVYRLPGRQGGVAVQTIGDLNFHSVEISGRTILTSTIDTTVNTVPQAPKMSCLGALKKFYLQVAP